MPVLEQGVQLRQDFIRRSLFSAAIKSGVVGFRLHCAVDETLKSVVSPDMVDWFGVVDGRPAEGRHSVRTPDMMDRLGVVDGPGAISGLSVGIPDITERL